MTSTPWAKLTLAVPGCVGHQARQKLARLHNDAGSPLPEAFFHYRDGSPIPDRLPWIRIGGSPKQIWITGLGREGVLLLYDHASTVARLFLEDQGRMPVFRLLEGKLTAEPTLYRVEYGMRNALVNLPDSAVKRLRDAGPNDPDGVAAIKVRLNEHLIRSFQEWLPDVPPPFIEDLRVQRTVPVRHAASSGWHLIAVSGTVTLRSRLKGPWQIGSRQARGYGMLYPLRRGSAGRVAA